MTIDLAQPTDAPLGVDAVADEDVDAVIAAYEDLDANHDPSSCADPTCATAPEGTEWPMMGMAFRPDGRITFHHSLESERYRIATAKREWRETCAVYLADPSDFVNAYRFVDTHPIFHRFHVAAPVDLPAAGPDRAAVLAQVETFAQVRADSGMSDAYLMVGRSEGTPVVMIEHGPHYWASDPGQESPAAGCSTHDHRLDVAAGTYEAAVVAFAAKVHEHYGTDRSRIHDDTV